MTAANCLATTYRRAPLSEPLLDPRVLLLLVASCITLSCATAQGQLLFYQYQGNGPDYLLKGWFSYPVSQLQTMTVGGQAVQYLDSEFITNPYFTFSFPGTGLPPLVGNTVGGDDDISINASGQFNGLLDGAVHPIMGGPAHSVNTQSMLNQNFLVHYFPAGSFLGGVGDWGGNLFLGGASQSAPLLPSSVDLNLFIFLAAFSGAWVDPPTAYGFDYAMTSGEKFTSITLPTGFDDPFTISSGGDTLGTVNPGGSFTFAGPGVSSFRITGINPLVDPEDTEGFPLQVFFDGPTADFTMSALNVPEPDALTLALLALVILPVARAFRVRHRFLPAN